jgi:hypothetical protein
MRLYDVEQSAQNLSDGNQESEEQLNQPAGPRPAENVYDKFSDFKV